MIIILQAASVVPAVAAPVAKTPLDDGSMTRVVHATALLFFKRFYVTQTVMDYDPKIAMLASILLACKVEEQVRFYLLISWYRMTEYSTNLMIEYNDSYLLGSKRPRVEGSVRCGGHREEASEAAEASGSGGGACPRARGEQQWQWRWCQPRHDPGVSAVRSLILLFIVSYD